MAVIRLSCDCGGRKSQLCLGTGGAWPAGSRKGTGTRTGLLACSSEALSCGTHLGCVNRATVHCLSNPEGTKAAECHRVPFVSCLCHRKQRWPPTSVSMEMSPTTGSRLRTEGKHNSWGLTGPCPRIPPAFHFCPKRNAHLLTRHGAHL